MRVKWPVILASASPRRAQLLRQVIDSFEIETSQVDEDDFVDGDPAITAQRLAREKCFAVFDRHPESLVIGGDTVVAYRDGEDWIQLAKPVSQDDAVRMLLLLAGRTHTVFTGVCLRWPKGLAAFTDSTEVTFRAISELEAKAYVATGGPMDKAGAYGLQDESQDFIKEVRGSVSNVIGLPMEKLTEALKGV